MAYFSRTGDSAMTIKHSEYNQDRRTREVKLTCVEITAPGQDPIRVVANFEDLIHNGAVYRRMPDLQVVKPQVSAGQLKPTSLVFLDPDTSGIQWLRKTTDPLPCRLFWVIVSEPDVIVDGPLDLLFVNESKSGAAISGSLHPDGLWHSNPCSAHTYGGRFPSLH